MWSQSPQAGQFNSYAESLKIDTADAKESLNPLKRVNSILTQLTLERATEKIVESQSPQAGQFNSYTQARTSKSASPNVVSIPSSGSIQFLPRHVLIGLISYE